MRLLGMRVDDHSVYQQYEGVPANNQHEWQWKLARVALDDGVNLGLGQ